MGASKTKGSIRVIIGGILAMIITFAIGKLFGISVSLIIQMLVLIAFTETVYKANWGNIGLVLLITVIYGLAIGAITLALGSLAKNQTSVSSYSSVILWGFSFLGGSFISFDSFSTPVQILHQLIPNGAALEAYISVANGNGLPSIYWNLLCITLYIVVFLGFTFLFLNRQGGANGNDNALKNAA